MSVSQVQAEPAHIPIFPATTTTSTSVIDDTVSTKFPPLPPIDSALPSFEQFMNQKRSFKSYLNGAQREHIIQRLKNENFEHLEEFLLVDQMKEGEFYVWTSYQEILASICEVYKTFKDKGGIYLRGGTVRDQFHSWLRECFMALYPNERELKPIKMVIPPPDVDILIDASNLKLDQVHEIEKAIFRHMAKVLSKDTPHLEEAYFNLTSWCWRDDRKDMYLGGEYTLTKLKCVNAPVLEIVIFTKLSRRYLCRLDKLSIQLQKKSDDDSKLKPVCNDGKSDDEAIWQVVYDIIHYYLTVDEPEKVDGLGFARIMTHIASGAMLKVEGTFRKLFYENKGKLTELEPLSLCKKFEKSCRDHLKGRPSALASMFWNLYVFTDFKEEIFFKKAQEHKAGLGFQKDGRLEAVKDWIVQEIEKVHSSVTFEYVEFEGKKWFRVRQYGAYWFFPEFQISDVDFQRLIAKARSRIPAQLLKERYPDIDVSKYQLPVAFVRMPQAQWHSRAYAIFREMPSYLHLKTAMEMVAAGHDSALDVLLQIYRKVTPEYELFFMLVNRYRSCTTQHIGIQAAELARLSLKLPTKTRKVVPDKGVRWLISHAPSPEVAYQVYQHLAPLCERHVPVDELVAKMPFESLTVIELLDHPVFANVPAKAQGKYIRDAFARTPPHFLDASLHRCVKENKMEVKEARLVFAENVNRFSYVIIDWVIDLFNGIPIPIELFRKMPFLAAQAIALKIVLEEDHFKYMVEEAFEFSAMEMHQFLKLHLKFVERKLIATETLILLVLGLIEEKKYEEATYWIEYLLEHSTPLHHNTRLKFLACCVKTGAITRAVDLALTFREAPKGTLSQELIHDLFDNKKSVLPYKLGLSEYFDVKGFNRWSRFVNNSPADIRIITNIKRAKALGNLSKVEARILIFDELFLLLSEVSNEHFETSLKTMLEYEDYVTNAHRKRLIGLLPTFFKGVLTPHESMIFVCQSLFAADEELFAEFILTLAADKELFILQSIALHILLKNFKHSYLKLGLDVLNLASGWIDASLHDLHLVELAKRVVNGKTETEELLKVLPTLICVASPPVQVLCGDILIEESHFKGDHKQVWSELVLLWLVAQCDMKAPLKVTKVQVEAIQKMITSRRTHFCSGCELPIVTTLIRFTKARIQASGNKPPDEATLLLIMLCINVMAYDFVLIRGREETFIEYARSGIELYSAFLRQPDLIFEESFFLFYSFLSFTTNAADMQVMSVRLSSNEPGVLATLEFKTRPQARPVEAAKVEDVVTAELMKQRAVEVRLKAEFLGVLIQSLPYQTSCYTKLLMTIKDSICGLVVQFKDHADVIIPLLHQFVFPRREPYRPALCQLRNAISQKFIKSCFFSLEIQKSKTASQELAFHFTKTFQAFMSKEEAVKCIKDMILRFIALNNPFWLFRALDYLPELKEMMDLKDYYRFSQTVYTEAASALGKVEGPYLEEPICITSVFYDQFPKSILSTNPNLMKLGLNIKTDVFKAILDGALLLIRRVSNTASYPFLLKELLNFMSKIMSEKLIDTPEIMVKYYGLVLQVTEDFALSHDEQLLIDKYIRTNAEYIKKKSAKEALLAKSAALVKARVDEKLLCGHK